MTSSGAVHRRVSAGAASIVVVGSVDCGWRSRGTGVQEIGRYSLKARLCQQPERLIYLLTVLARDGKVTRVTVDATNGAVIGGL